MTDGNDAISPSRTNDEALLTRPVGGPTLQERLAKMQQVLYKKTTPKTIKSNDEEPISPVTEQTTEDENAAEMVTEKSIVESLSGLSAAQKAANRISTLLGRKDDAVTTEAPGAESNKKSASSRVKSFFGGRSTSKQQE